jgi:hypothetical protein
MVKTAIVFDCEFLCIAGSPSRFWCGALDPDPVAAQIDAVKLGLEGDFPLLKNYRAYVQPVDRYGRRNGIDPFFTKLTGITEENIQAEGLPLQEALLDLDRFSEGARFWSWGKDDSAIHSCQSVRQCLQARARRRYANRRSGEDA